MSTNTITQKQFANQFANNEIRLDSPALQNAKQLQHTLTRGDDSATKALDTNNDGIITLQEVDTNGDGKISGNELGGLYKFVDSFDANKSSKSFTNKAKSGQLYASLQNAKTPASAYRGAASSQASQSTKLQGLASSPNYKNIKDKAVKQLAQLAVELHGDKAMRLINDPDFAKMSKLEKFSMLKMLTLANPNNEHNTLPSKVKDFKAELGNLHTTLNGIVGKRAFSHGNVAALARSLTATPHLLFAVDTKTREGIVNVLMGGMGTLTGSNLADVKGALASFKNENPALYKSDVQRALQRMGDTTNQATKKDLGDAVQQELIKQVGGQLLKKLPFAGPLLEGIAQCWTNDNKLDMNWAAKTFGSIVSGGFGNALMATTSSGAAGGPLVLLASVSATLLDISMKYAAGRATLANAKQAMADPSVKP